MQRDVWEGTSRLFHASEKRRIRRLSECGARQIVIARPFVADRAIDEDEIRRGSDWSNLASGRHADQQPATGCEKLLSDQHGKRRADDAIDDANFADADDIEGEKFGVIAGPSLMDAARAGPFEMAYDIAIRI